MATIEDVAKAAGLSVGTVSRVMNNRGYIGEKTRERVNSVMKQLGYQPNELARSLAMQTNNTIGLIVPHISHPYFAKLISHLESECAALGFKAILCNSKSDTERETEYIEMCRGSRVAGIVLCSASVDIGKLQGLKIPIITIERSENCIATASVDCDNYAGGQLAARHLLEKGCTRLLHFSGVLDVNMPADKREEGFADVCRGHNVPYSVMKNSARAYYDIEYGEYVRGALANNRGADGIFASSDVIAAQVLQECAGLGLRVPGDIKVVGFDDAIISRLTTPPLTTIRQPLREMAELAAGFIKKHQAGGVIPTQTVLPVTLIQRGTT